MTIAALKPVFWMLVLLVVSIALGYTLPEEIALTIRLFNGALIVVLLVWRGLTQHRQDTEVLTKLDQVIAAINADITHRILEIRTLQFQAEEMAAKLEHETILRRKEAEKALTDQTAALTERIQESTDASRHAHREANNTNEKIAALYATLMKAIPPQSQVDDIQATGHESKDMLVTLIEHPPEKDPS